MWPFGLALRGLRAFSCAALTSAALAACGANGGSGEKELADGGALDGAVAERVDAAVSDASPADAAVPLSAPELARITAHLTSDDLAGRNEGSPGGLAARAFLIGELEACGLEPLGESFEQPITGGRGANILARIPGSAPSLAPRTVLLSAHYDHLGPCGAGVCRGAVDNAAGVALVVAVACTLRELHPARSLLVALWDAEEPPTFLTPQMGSRYYAEHPVAPLEDLDVAIVLDLIGGDLWPGFPGHFLAGAETSRALESTLRGIAPPAGLELFAVGFHVAEEWPTGHQAWSDYDAFRNRRIPSLLLSDGQNRNYHTPGDDFANVDLAKLAAEGRYLLDVVTALLAAEETPVFQPGGADYLGDADTVLRLIGAALAPGGLVDALAQIPETRTRLELDRSDVEAARARLAAGSPAGAAELRAIRLGGQRVLCLAGNTYPESTCTFH